MRTSSMRALGVCGLAICIGALSAADWPGWRGPDRTGVSTEKGLLKTWPMKGPELVWQTNKAGLGYAGMAVVGGVVYTMAARDKDEYVIALDDKGQEKWAEKIGPVHDWKANSWSRGPNGTPTVDGDFVYALGSHGGLVCVEKKGGKPVWKKDMLTDLLGEVNPIGGGVDKPMLGWGYSWSPLIDGENLIIAPGGPKGLLAALDKKTGALKWRSDAVPDQATYGSPVLATIGGVKQYVYVVQTGVVGISAMNMALLWRYTRENPYPDIVAATPIVKDDLVYVSVGWLGGSTCLKPTPNGKVKVEEVYANKVLGNKHGGVVLVGKDVLGFNEDARWVCQDFATGKIVWPKGRGKPQKIKFGAPLAADGRLYILDVAGNVSMLEAKAKGFTLISQFELPQKSDLRKSSGGIWTPPSLSDGKLYVRDQELIFCYQVK